MEKINFPRVTVERFVAQAENQFEKKVVEVKAETAEIKLSNKN